MPNEKALRDLEEMIPGNNLIEVYGHDDPKQNQWDHWDYEQCQEMIDHELDEPYREALLYLYPEGLKV